MSRELRGTHWQKRGSAWLVQSITLHVRRHRQSCNCSPHRNFAAGGSVWWMTDEQHDRLQQIFFKIKHEFKLRPARKYFPRLTQHVALIFFRRRLHTLQRPKRIDDQHRCAVHLSISRYIPLIALVWNAIYICSDLYTCTDTFFDRIAIDNGTDSDFGHKNACMQQTASAVNKTDACAC